jgi:hypothetical protein
MKVFSIHIRRGGLDPARDVVLVKEGFCWPAFFFSVLWALWHRLWLVALGFFAAAAALNGLVALFRPDPVSQAVLSLGLATIMGLVANDLRRWTLERRGFVETAVVAGPDADAAEHRFYDRNPEIAAEIGR